MKKITAAILAILLLTLTTSAALAKTTYDPNKLHFVILAADEKTGETYVTAVTYKTAVKRIATGLVYEVYLMEENSLIPVDFATNEDGEIILTNRITLEIIEQ